MSNPADTGALTAMENRLPRKVEPGGNFKNLVYQALVSPNQ